MFSQVSAIRFGGGVGTRSPGQVGKKTALRHHFPTLKRTRQKGLQEGQSKKETPPPPLHSHGNVNVRYLLFINTFYRLAAN